MADLTVYAGTYYADGALTGWTNPQNAFSNDGTYATRAGTNKSEWYGNVYAFDMSSLPDTATLGTITLAGEWINSAVDTNGPEFFLNGYNAGTAVGTGTTDTTGGTVVETVSYNLPAGLTVAQLKTSGTAGFGAIVRFRRKDNTAHTASLDYVNVTVNYSLSYSVTPGEGNQAQTGDTASVSAEYPVTPEEGAQAQTGDTAVVYATYTVTPAEGAQAQTGDAATVSFAAADISVTPAEGNQAQTGDAAGVSAGYFIATAEGAQTQTGDDASGHAGYEITSSSFFGLGISDQEPP